MKLTSKKNWSCDDSYFILKLKYTYPFHRPATHITWKHIARLIEVINHEDIKVIECKWSTSRHIKVTQQYIKVWHWHYEIYKF